MLHICFWDSCLNLCYRSRIDINLYIFKFCYKYVYGDTDQLCMHISVQHFLYKGHCHFIVHSSKLFKSCHMSLCGTKKSKFWYVVLCYTDILFKKKVINNTWVLNVISYPLRYNNLCYMFSRNAKLVSSIFWLNKNDVTKWYDAKEMSFT